MKQEMLNLVNINIDQECDKCGLYKSCKSPNMPPEGSEDSEVLVVGEAPGATEDELNRPFTGESGQILRTVLKNVGFGNNVVFTNVCRCRPPNNATPTSKEIEYCFGKTLDLIKRMKNLKLIIAVGDVALKAFLNKRGITKFSGKLLRFNNIKFVPVFHPASILHSRDRRKIELLETHLKRAFDYFSKEDYQNQFGDYYLIETIEDWKNLYGALKKSKIFAFDIETTSLKHFMEDFNIRLISFCMEPKIAYSVNVEKLKSFDKFSDFVSDLKEIMENPNILKIGHNIKFDSLGLRVVWGISVESIVWDTQVASYLLGNQVSHKLKELAYLVDCGGYDVEVPEYISQLPITETIWRYNAIDSDVTFRLFLKQKEEFNSEKKIYRAFKSIFVPMIKILETMEYNGIRVNVDNLNKSWSRVQYQMDKIVKEIHQIDSVKKYMEVNQVEFNPNSTKMLSEILYHPDYEGLPYKKLTQKSKQPSVKIKYLEELAPVNSLAKYMVDYLKLKSMDKIIQDIYANISSSNKIHTVFNLTSTISGRSSSEAPNLHAIPKGDRDIIKIREAFIPDDGYIFFEFDYNQWELRCAADLSGDEALKEAILSGDVHREIASAILGIPPDKVTDDQRRNIGKTMAFGTLYQMTPYGIMDRLGLMEKYKSMYPSLSIKEIKILAEQEAKEYINKFFNKFKKLKLWVDNIIEYVKKYRYIETKIGLKKYFPKDMELTDHEIRSAVNLPIQSLAAHILYISLIGIDKFIKKCNLKSRIVLEIHDSILMEIHETEKDIVEDIVNIMKNYVHNYIPFSIPIDLDIKYGMSLGRMEKWGK